MGQIAQNPLLLDVIFNEEKKQFEVYAFDEVNQVKSLMLIQTIEDVKEQLREMMISTLKNLTYHG